MDSTDLSNALSSLTLSRDEENTDENSMIVPTTKRTRFLATYRLQNFSLPKSIMLHLAKNPTSPEFYLKMIQVCKFFFVQNPILILQDSTYNGIDWKLDGGEFGPYIDTELESDENEFFANQELTSVDFNNLTSKLWVTDKFCVRAKKYNDPNIISSIIPKFFRFDARELRIENQVIPLKDYVYLVSSTEIVRLHDVTVKDENGSDLSIVKLVEIASKVKSFECYSDKILSNITSKTFGELLKIPHFFELDYFYLAWIPEAFNLEAFYSYMKKNKKTSFNLNFDHSISEPYKNRLEQIVDEVMATKSREYIKPLFSFYGLDDGKWLELYYMTPQYMRY